jgi:hypothetical protein
VGRAVLDESVANGKLEAKIKRMLTSISGPSKPILPVLPQTGTDLHPTRSVRHASGLVLTLHPETTRELDEERIAPDKRSSRNVAEVRTRMRRISEKVILSRFELDVPVSPEVTSS